MTQVRSLSGEDVKVLARFLVREEHESAFEWKTMKKQGYMTKQGGGNSLMGRKNWKKRFFDLRDGVLSYAEQPNEPDLGVIVLKGARLEDVSNSEDGPQLCVTVVEPEKRTFVLRAPDAQSHTAWLAVLQRVVDSMKRKTMPENFIEIAEDGVRLFDALTSQQVAFFKITKLRNWKATQTHLHLCVDVKKVPESHLFRTDNAGTLAKALNKVAKHAAKSSLSKSADFGVDRLPKSPRSPQEYYADEGDNAPPPPSESYYHQQQQQRATQRSPPPRAQSPPIYESERPAAPPPAQFSKSQPLPLAMPPPLTMSIGAPAPAATLSPRNNPEMFARALYDYEPKDETRLAMHRGDQVRIVKEIDEHWFRCQLGERKGIVPRSYVRVCTNEIVAKAIGDFDDGDENHLRFDKHEKIVVLTRVEQSDWWDGIITVGDEGNQYTRVGIFPIVLVEVVQGQHEFDSIVFGQQQQQ